MSHWASTWAYEQDVQPAGRKFVLVALAGFADEDGFCYPGQETLAKMTGQDLRTVQRHLKSLEKDSVIQRKARWKKAGGRNSDGYTLQAPPARLNPKATNCQVSKATNCPDDKLPPDLSENRFDPSVKKEPLLPPKKNYKPPVEIVVGPPPPHTGTEFLRQLADFEIHRKRLRCPLNELSRVRIYSALEKVDEATATKALDDSIQNGWKGVFPERVTQNGANGNGHTKNSDDRPIWMASKK